MVEEPTTRPTNTTFHLPSVEPVVAIVVLPLVGLEELQPTNHTCKTAVADMQLPRTGWRYAANRQIIH